MTVPLVIHSVSILCIPCGLFKTDGYFVIESTDLHSFELICRNIPADIRERCRKRAAA